MQMSADTLSGRGPLYTTWQMVLVLPVAVHFEIVSGRDDA